MLSVQHHLHKVRDVRIDFDVGTEDSLQSFKQPPTIHQERRLAMRHMAIQNRMKSKQIAKV
jgi:hypothetical protein